MKPSAMRLVIFACLISAIRSLSFHHGLSLRFGQRLRSASFRMSPLPSALPLGGRTSSSINLNGIDIDIDRNVTILSRGPNHIVALKPPSVVCHHSGWTGSRSKAKRGEIPEIPMLQRVRDAIHDIDSRSGGAGDNDDTNTNTEDDAGAEKNNNTAKRVNLVHRLDRGASGALLLTFADERDRDGNDYTCTNNNNDYVVEEEGNKSQSGATAQLIDAMASEHSVKTYVALVRGEGILRGEDLKQNGWFNVTRPIKDESGVEKDATTEFNFVAGQPEVEYVDEKDGMTKTWPRISLVLARPKQGRWHQIRRHLNGLSHPILGDTTHGASKTNREWKEQRNLPGERLCLHMARMQLVPCEAVPEGIDVSCPLLDDMLDMLRVYAPNVLEEARPILEQEGLLIEIEKERHRYQVGEFTIPDVFLLDPKKDNDDDEPLEILVQDEHHVVVSKPPSVVCHHSSWTGKRSDVKRRWKEPTPMLQRVRDATGRRVNLVHRLDRGASGCLLLSFAQNQSIGSNEATESDKEACEVTSTLISSMQSPQASKTYVAFCDGDGTWNGQDFLNKGWFTVEIPVKDEWGKEMNDVRTDLKFIASVILPPTTTATTSKSNHTCSEQGDDNDTIKNKMEGRKVSIVLARPHTGKWHQIRQHLASGTIGHAILGDSSHGRTRTNRIWRKKRNMQKERTCLHLARLQLPATKHTPDGIDVTCPLPKDLQMMLNCMPESFVRESRDLMSQEGINIY